MDTIKRFYSYYETSHYRPLVGDMIVERVYHGAPPSPCGFGVYVTRENVEAHLQALTKQ